jgi:hypothetical protein
LFKEIAMSVSAQWWGYSSEHGWVIMDRDIPGNSSGIRGDLLFFRCRDGKVFFLKREQWRSPTYQYAPNHVRAQPPDKTAETGAELAALMERWPEFQLAIRRQHDEIAGERDAESRAQTKRMKRKLEETEKQRAATDGLRSISVPKLE